METNGHDAQRDSAKITEDETCVVDVLRARGDHYAVLGATIDMTKEEIRACYYRKSRSCHPDKNEHSKATEAMQLVTQAWAFLQEPKSRRAYDKNKEQRNKTPKNRQSNSSEKTAESESSSKTAGRWKPAGPDGWKPAGEEEVPMGFPQSFGPHSSWESCGPSASSCAAPRTHIKKAAPPLVCEFCDPSVRNNSFVGVYIGRRDEKGHDLPLMVCSTCFKLVEHMKMDPGQALPDESDEEDFDLQAGLRASEESDMQQRSHDQDLEKAIAASMRPTEDDIAFAKAVAASLNTTENYKPWDISQESACGPE